MKQRQINLGKMVKNSEITTYMDYGKIPPQAIDLEEAVLGAIILESRLLADVLDYLFAESFYKEVHQIIFNAILGLNDRHETVDLLSLTQELRKNNQLDEVGGPVYLARLTSNIGSGSNIEFYAKVVAEKFIKREIIRISHELEQSMYDDSIDLLDAVNTFDNARNLVLSFTKKEEVHIKQAVKDAINKSIELNQGKAQKGIPTGFTYFDDFSGGIQKGDLMIIAGETSNGKTTLALNISGNTAQHKTNVAIFSYEMTIFQLTARLIANQARMSSKDIIRGAIDDKTLWKTTGNITKLTNSELYLVRPNGSSFSNLKNDIIRMVKLYGIELVVIDYLQLINNHRHNSSKEDMIATMCNELKSLSVQLDIGTILLSQLKRADNPRPTLSRLKGSGDIENSADIVMFTYLPFKYNLGYENINGENIEVGENAIVIVDKGRNIGTCQFMLDFKKDIPAFYNHSNFVIQDPINFIEPKDKTFDPFN